MNYRKGRPIMRIIYIFIFTMLIASFTPSAAHAQKSFGAFSKSLAKINRIKPLQNPYFIQSEDILNRDIVDTKYRVVGDLEDVILSQSGTIETLNVKFNRLHLPSVVSLDYQNMGIESETNNYALDVSSDVVEEIYPELLASISPASGGNNRFFSLQNMIGSRVQSDTGTNIGEVTEVLFNSYGNKVEALYVEVARGPNRGKGIAIPFNNLDIKGKGRGIEVTLSKVQTKAFWNFTKGNR